MTTPSTGIIDDYLEGLLHDVVAADTALQIAPATSAMLALQDADAPAATDEAAGTHAQTAVLLVDVDVDAADDAEEQAPSPVSVELAQAGAPLSTGPTAEELVAMVLAEADADPDLAGIMSGQAAAPASNGPTPEELVAMVLAEADADPDLAGIMSAQAVAQPSKGPTPEELAAMVLAEADADPALAGIMSGQAVAQPSKGPTPEELAAMVLAEADADPALAGIMSGQAAAPASKGPTPEELVAMVLAEADADPALAGIMSGQAQTASRSLAEADDAATLTAAKRVPMAVPPERRAEAERARNAPASQVPPNLQAFLPPSGPSEPTLQHRRARDRSTRWLRLRCGEQAYALELLKVQEVVLPVPLLPLRGTPPAMLGIMNLRGQVVPVIDLGLHLGAAPIDMDTLTRVVVLEEHGETLGLRVSAVEDVTSLTDQQIEPPDNARICRISNDLFRGVARLAGPPMILLDAEQLLH